MSQTTLPGAWKKLFETLILGDRPDPEVSPDAALQALAAAAANTAAPLWPTGRAGRLQVVEAIRMTYPAMSLHQVCTIVDAAEQTGLLTVAGNTTFELGAPVRRLRDIVVTWRAGEPILFETEPGQDLLAPYWFSKTAKFSHRIRQADSICSAVNEYLTALAEMADRLGDDAPLRQAAEQISMVCTKDGTPDQIGAWREIPEIVQRVVLAGAPIANMVVAGLEHMLTRRPSLPE